MIRVSKLIFTPQLHQIIEKGLCRFIEDLQNAGPF